MEQNRIIDVAIGIGTSSPSCLLYIVASLVALATWRRNPGVSTLVLAAVAAWAIALLLSLAFYQLLLPSMYERMGYQEIRGIQAGAGFLLNLLQTVGGFLLVTAAFKGRGTQSQSA